MNTHRRLLAALLITLSCLFALQPAGAMNAQGTSSDDPLCGITEPLPENFPDWIEKPERTNVQCESADAGSLCGDVAPLPANFPDWIETPGCTLVQSDAHAVPSVAEVDVCANIGPMVFNLGFVSAVPTGVTFSAPACYDAQAAGDTGNSGESRLPAEGSTAASDEESENAKASAGQSNVQDLVQGLPGEIGPTI